jgi:hypothetical protein
LGGTIVKSVPITIPARKFAVNHRQALLYSNSAQETASLKLRSIKLSTCGAIFMGTPELDSRLAGLQSYLAGAAGSGQESTDIYKEAHWLVTTLQNYALISQQIWTLFIHERAEPSSTKVTSDQVRRCIHWRFYSSSNIHLAVQARSSHVFIKADHGEMIKFETVSEGYLQVKNQLDFVLKKETSA